MEPPMKMTLAVLALLAISEAAWAAEPDSGFCRNGSFAADHAPFGLGKVQGAGRLPFLEDMNGCPGQAARCAAGPYVVLGDTVLTGRRRGAYTCAFYPNRGGGTAGWVRSDRLAPLPVGEAVALGAWAGRWRNGDDTIRLQVKGSALTAEGDAYWPSANPTPEERPGGPNVGNFSGVAKPAANRVEFSDDVCKVKLSLVGQWLLASDNGGCGGMNVTFTGVYSRK
jgi:hypothetical protein